MTYEKMEKLIKYLDYASKDELIEIMKWILKKRGRHYLFVLMKAADIALSIEE